MVEPFCAPLCRRLGRRDREKGMREHGQGDVPHPSDVAADFVLVQAALVLRSLEAFLDRPPMSGNAHELVDTGSHRRVCEVVGDLIGSADAAPGQRPAVTGGPLTVEVLDHRELDGCPVIDARALGAVAARTLLPCLIRCLAEEIVDRPKRGTGWDFGTAST